MSILPIVPQTSDENIDERHYIDLTRIDEHVVGRSTPSPCVAHSIFFFCIVDSRDHDRVLHSFPPTHRFVLLPLHPYFQEELAVCVLVWCVCVLVRVTNGKMGMVTSIGWVRFVSFLLCPPPNIYFEPVIP